MRLHLVRHPRPDIREGLCYGHTDLPATVDDALLARLTTTLPAQALLFSSPMKRCLELARLLSSAKRYPTPILDDRLVEMNFGSWEMRAWNDIPREEVDAWTADLSGYRPGGGESVLQVAKRVRAFRDDIVRKDVQDVVVVCHAGTMRLLIAARHTSTVEETAITAAQSAHHIAYGELIVLECSEA